MILASGSPRRRELLKREGFNFNVIKPSTDETLTHGIKVEEQVMKLAKEKALDVYKNHKDTIIAADTVVYINDTILGKPRDKDHAFEMLDMLRNKEHFVLTGVCIIKDGKLDTFFDKTKIKFRNYSNDEIMEYINTNEPFDKAGSYAIQGLGGKLVESYYGDFDNVVGLPIKKIKEHLI